MPGHGRQGGPAAVRQGPADHEQDAGPGDDDQHDRSGREPRKLPRRNHTATITPAGRPDNPYRARRLPGPLAGARWRPDNPYRGPATAWTPGRSPLATR